MFDLREYRRRATQLPDYLPWAALVGAGVVLNKDGAFQRTARFRGPDLDSATSAELVAAAGRLNAALRRLGSGWAIFVEAQRNPAETYPQSDFPDPVSALVDEERRAQFEAHGAHFDSAYFLTFVYLPPAERTARAEGWLYEGRARRGVDWREQLEAFVDRTDRVLALLEGFIPEAAWLSDVETLTYLHSTVSTSRHRVGVPDTPMHLDVLLADQPLAGGLEPRLGSWHLRVLTISGFPASTWPGLLDELNRLAFPYRWTTRAICLDKVDAARLLGRPSTPPPLIFTSAGDLPMKARIITAAAAAALTLSLAGPAGAQRIVYDPTNYASNVMQAARALEQINNQIRSLQNQAQSLQNQARNLAQLPYSSVQALQGNIGRVGGLLQQAQRIAYDVQAIEREFSQNYSIGSGGSDTALIAQAKARWLNSASAFQHALQVQAGVVAGIDSSRTELGKLVGSSQGATGILQATQAGNQLLALQSQQLTDLTAMMAAQGRAAALEQLGPANTSVARRPLTAPAPLLMLFVPATTPPVEPPFPLLRTGHERLHPSRAALWRNARPGDPVSTRCPSLGRPHRLSSDPSPQLAAHGLRWTPALRRPVGCAGLAGRSGVCDAVGGAGRSPGPSAGRGARGRGLSPDRPADRLALGAVYRGGPLHPGRSGRRSAELASRVRLHDRPWRLGAE